MANQRVKKTVGLRIEPLEARRLLAADPIISEFLASNRDGITDANGAASDWIEIYNAGDEAVDLVDYSLTDDPANARKWVFPNQSLNPGQFVLVFASGDGIPDSAGTLHTNFKLSADGEYIALHDPNGTVLSEYGPDGTDFPEQNSDVSFGVGFNTNSTEAINATSTSRYLIPNNGNVDSVWRNATFNDASWTAGTAALGYENSPTSSTSYSSLIGTNLPSGTTTAYVRIPFEVADESSFLGELRLRYDDGFVAHINGQEVARSNAPASLTYQSVATAENPDNFARNEQIFDVRAFSQSLHVGTNILSIQMLNRSSGSSDFLASPRLSLTSGTLTGTAQGQLISPTPAAPNSALLANEVAFSREGGIFTGSTSVSLSTIDATETIRYTTNGTTPTTSSPIFSSPINITTRTTLTARAFGADGQVGNPTSETFTPTSGTVSTVTSDLPIIVLENFSQGVPGATIFDEAVLSLFEPDPDTGRTSLTSEATLSINAAIRRRGSSTAGNPKSNYRVEIQDINGDDQAVSLLGMPAESDWVLYAPYQFDRAMLRNPFFFEISNQMGFYAPRTRFVEVYSNVSNGTLSSADYMGVYVLMENVKRDADRVDIAELSPNDNSGEDITGGYILQIDRPEDGAWETSRGNPTEDGNNFFVPVDPDRGDLTQAQYDYIRNYVEDLEDALYGPNSTDPELGYEAFLDVDSAIDHHIVKTFSKDPDGLRLSTYLVKDKNGKLEFGPVWDFDRTAGNDNDSRSANPFTWDVPSGDHAPFFEYDWWGELFDDPDFTQRWIDRWGELRQTVLSDANIAATVDAQAAEIREAQARNFSRWTAVAPNGGTFADPGTSGWEAEVSHFKNWLLNRAEFMDSQILGAPAISPASGNVSTGTNVVLTPDKQGDTVYYTLDGSDPRGENGEIAPAAIAYAGPIPINGSATVMARSFGSITPTATTGTNSSYPGNEAPRHGIDNNPNTKYLNFGEENSGIIITTGTSVVQSIRLTTANDAVERDPTSYELYGTNETIRSTDNSTGLAENWTLISSGSINLPNARFSQAPVLSFGNSTAYSSYKLMFPTVKNASSANSMQISEISFHATTNGSGADVISPNDRALAVHVESASPTSDGLSPWSTLASGSYSTSVPANATNLRITELHFHPQNPLDAESAILPQVEDDDFEFIELTNISDQTVSLVGAEFTTGITFDFNTSLIPSVGPGQSVLLVEDTTAFRVRYPDATLPIAGEYSGNLANGGERVTLRDSSGNVIHDFFYDDTADWPTMADGDGPSLEVVNVFGNYNDPQNWRAVASNGTPNEIPGDIDGNGHLTCGDINALSRAVLTNANDPLFDIDGNGTTDSSDVDYWLSRLMRTQRGDANLDGLINNEDFAAWNTHRFVATNDYCNGDFNGDGIADTSDFNLWNVAREAFFASSSAAAVDADVFNFASFDQNGDNVVSPLDALRVINYLNEDRAYDAQFDLNQDLEVTPLDALLVINHLNNQNEADDLETSQEKRIDSPFFANLGDDDDEDDSSSL